MTELIKITEKDGQQLVSAKEMYIALGLSPSQWSRWYHTNIIENEFFSQYADY